ncbi:MAG: LysR family transcriptional regulator [Gammaproteobacteria bacterium]|nr:LysR family transcriptional regulator [Gammaproteobacteria bacterium]
MIEIRHLRTLHALREEGSLAAAAEHLHLTPSALSHQLKELEQWLSLSLLSRKTKPLQFSAAGQRLLELADQVLPLVHNARSDLARLAHGQTGRLLLASECHSCFDWLMPVLNRYRHDFPDVDLDFSSGFEPEPHAQLQQGEIDLLVTTDCLPMKGIQYYRLFDYESRLVLSPSHQLATQEVVTPEDVAAQTLIAYPVEPTRLDIVAGYLAPYGLQPAKLRTTELTPMLIQLVASGRGIAALPDWVVKEYEQKGWVVSRRLTPKPSEQVDEQRGTQGLRRTLYVAVRQVDEELVFMQGFLQLLIRMTQNRQ